VAGPKKPLVVRFGLFQEKLSRISARRIGQKAKRRAVGRAFETSL
jgi:hypothetical protein